MSALMVTMLSGAGEPPEILYVKRTTVRVTDRGASATAVYLALTAAMALFGSAFAASKALADALPPEVAAALRFGCGALVLLVWLGVTGRGFGLPARDWPRILAAGALGVFAFNWLFFWGLHTLLGRRILAGIDPLKATALAMSVGALMLVVAAAAAMRSVSWSNLSGGIWLDIFYLGIGPTAIAYAAYLQGIRAIGPAQASIMMFLVPVFGAAPGPTRPASARAA